MAKANQCDICKKFYAVESDSVVIVIKRPVFFIRDDFYDVCPECAKKIEAFIKGKTEELK